jgi:hypothetical protein
MAHKATQTIKHTLHTMNTTTTTTTTTKGKAITVTGRGSL